MREINDLTGKRFERLIVLRRAPKPNHLKNSGECFWLCRCDCGKEKVISGKLLQRKETRSCGCLRKDLRTRTPPYNALGKGEAAFNSMLYAYKKRAKNKNFEFSLSDNEFKSLTQQKCYYCGSLPSQEYKNSGNSSSYIYNGIDRLDPAIGYTKDNCVASCKICNYSKLNMSLEEFKLWIKKVVTNLML